MGATVDQKESRVLSSSASSHGLRGGRRAAKGRAVLRWPRASRRSQDDSKENIVVPSLVLDKVKITQAICPCQWSGARARPGKLILTRPKQDDNRRSDG